MADTHLADDDHTCMWHIHEWNKWCLTHIEFLYLPPRHKGPSFHLLLAPDSRLYHLNIYYICFWKIFFIFAWWKMNTSQQKCSNWALSDFPAGRSSRTSYYSTSVHSSAEGVSIVQPSKVCGQWLVRAKPPTKHTVWVVSPHRSTYIHEKNEHQCNYFLILLHTRTCRTALRDSFALVKEGFQANSCMAPDFLGFLIADIHLFGPLPGAFIAEDPQILPSLS